MPLLTGLKVINGPGAAPANAQSPNPMQALSLNLEAAAENTKKSLEGFQQNLGNLSARATKFFSSVGDMVPTQHNKEKRAALRIQKAYRSFAARGHFHEERGAVLMLQAAARRHKAQNIGKYKRTLVHWAAMTIQENWRRHQKRKQRAAAKAAREAAEAQRLAEEAAAAAKSGGIITKLSRSLSFTKRNKKNADGSTPRAGGEDAPSLPTPVLSGASTTASEASPTAGAEPVVTKKRSLSFTRRTKKATPAATDNVEDAKQVM